MKKKTIAGCVLAGSMLLSLAAPAAEPAPRQGFGISFGLGFGSGKIDVDCAGCSDRDSGFSGYLRLGGYLRPNLFLAFESNGFTSSTSGVDTTASLYSAALQWYPNVDKGFYLKGSLGVTGVTVEDGTDELEASAIGLGLGVGYDIRMGRNFSLTPFMNMVVTGNGDLELNGADTSLKAKFNFIQLGLGFTWH